MGQVITLPMQPPKLKQIIEAALLAASRPLSLDQLLLLFVEEELPDRSQVRAVIDELRNEYEGRGIELREVGSGFRIQVRAELAPWVSRLWDERPGRYSRALMETLALVAYRQPVTRAEIEDVRGVSVTTNIVKTLMEREWIHVVGHRDVPGKPALYATTRKFLDYFGLKSLDDLPTLAEIRDLESIDRELDLEGGGEAAGPVPLETRIAAADTVPAEEGPEPVGDEGERVQGEGPEAATSGVAPVQEPSEAAAAARSETADSGGRPDEREDDVDQLLDTREDPRRDEDD